MIHSLWWNTHFLMSMMPYFNVYRKLLFKWTIFITFHSQVYTWWCGFKFIIHFFNGLFKVPVSMLFEKLFVPSDELSFVWYGTGLMATRLSNISRTLAFTYESRGARGVSLVVYSFVVMKQRNKRKKKRALKIRLSFLSFPMASLSAAVPRRIIWARLGKVIGFSSLWCDLSPLVVVREGEGDIRQTAHPCLGSLCRADRRREQQLSVTAQ